MADDWTGDLLGIKDVVDATGETPVALPRRSRLRISGNATVSDNPVTGELELAVGEGGSSITLPIDIVDNTEGTLPTFRGGTGTSSSGYAGQFLGGGGVGWTFLPIPVIDPEEDEGKFITVVDGQYTLATVTPGGGISEDEAGDISITRDVRAGRDLVATDDVQATNAVLEGGVRFADTSAEIISVLEATDLDDGDGREDGSVALTLDDGVYQKLDGAWTKVAGGGGLPDVGDVRDRSGNSRVESISGDSIGGVDIAADTFRLGASGLTFARGLSTVVIGEGSIAAPTVDASSYVGIGSTPRAAAGLVRLGQARLNNSKIVTLRNDANNGDWDLFAFSSNGFYIGANNYLTRIIGASVAFVSASGAEFGISGTTVYGSNVVMLSPFSTGGNAHGGNRILYLHNATAVPNANPSAAVLMYVESGALKARSPAGTIATLVTNDPHCPKCGTDAGVTETRNDVFGEELIVCKMCETRTGNGVIRCVTDFWEWKVAA